MKNFYRSFIAIILAITMLFSVSPAAVFAKSEKEPPIKIVTDILGGIVDGMIKILGFLAPTPDYITIEEYFSKDSENFYE